jgi:predicted Rossmann fold flavoprotein
MEPLNVVVLGGGAAGFFAAITCAETFPHSQVCILEKNRRVLDKVRISGGGRCNVTYACFDPALLVQSYPRGGRALRGPFSRFQPRDTVAWFNARGVALKTEPDGRVFPVSDDSATIVNCLVDTARAAGVAVQTGAAIVDVERRDGAFIIRLKSGEAIPADRLLLATGSNRQGYAWAVALGHTVEPPVPSLFTFTIADPRLDGLAGLSVANVRARLPEAGLAQEGPLLVTHWGLSGPAVLKLSAWGARYLHDQAYHATLEVDWLPQLDGEALRQALAAARAERARRLVAGEALFGLPQRLWRRLVAAAGVVEEQRWADMSNKELSHLAGELSRGRFLIAGKGLFKEEFVTCGGVRLDEVDFRTMESRRCPHLYLAGEILDVDAVTGGFNFQSAWTTGYLAGQAMGHS